MSFYRDHVVPHLLNAVMRHPEMQPYRHRVVGAATGRVLEVGMGSGLNFALYPQGVTEIIGLEPGHKLVALARRNAGKAPAPVSFLETGAETIPLESGSVDTVVMTWVLCHVPQESQAVQEIRRVLKPGGQLLFVEHGRAPEAGVSKWQDRLTPAWKRLAGGCRLNLSPDQLVTGGGLRLDRLATGYMKGPKPMAYMYEGRAVPP